jgi:hypothetical protein
MAITKASASGLAGSRFKDASAGTTKIVDVPDAPTIGTATNLDLSASISFTAASRGGVPTSYTVTSTPGTLTATGSSSPIVVTGLTLGTSYTFKVKATNSTGTGAESSATNSVTASTAVWTFATTLDSSQNYTVPNSVSAIAAFAISGGEAGAAGSGQGGGGGGRGGRAAAAILNTPTPSTQYYVTVGGAGLGDSSFGSIISSAGNGNGTSIATTGYNNANGQAGGNIALAGVTNINFGGSGGAGGSGGMYDGQWDVYNSGSGGQAGGAPAGGGGGSGGTMQGYWGASSNGQPGGAGSIPGGGGGGVGGGYAGNYGQGPAGNGGAGGGGRVVIWEKRVS